MLQFRGEPAHSDFRLQKLLQQISAINRRITPIDSHYWYFCAARSELNVEEMQALYRLLNVDGELHGHQSPGGEFFLILPRLGTISPWSSKATDIAHHCGLTQIERIERGYGDISQRLKGILSIKRA